MKKKSFSSVHLPTNVKRAAKVLKEKKIFFKFVLFVFFNVTIY